MTAGEGWHVPDDLLERYLGTGALDPAAAASVEDHLLACAVCRARCAAAPGAAAAAAASWSRIADRLDRPRPVPLARLLERLGSSEATGRLVAATPSLRAAALCLVAAFALVAVAASRVTGEVAVFLAVAPLCPLAAVALAFAPGLDPGGEAGVATPLHGLALVLRRLLAVLGATLVVLLPLSVAVPQVDGGALAWVLPGLALAGAAIALGSWVRLELAVGGLASGWVLTVVAVAWTSPARLLGPAGQLASLAVVAVAAGVVLARRARYATLEVFR